MEKRNLKDDNMSNQYEIQISTVNIVLLLECFPFHWKMFSMFLSFPVNVVKASRKNIQISINFFCKSFHHIKGTKKK